MAEVSLYNMNGEKTGTLSLMDELFAVEVKPHLVHASVVQYLANQRQGTKSTKTRAEVRGGGRKPWRQKGTGRARQGSIRSPQWVGGGVVFAPKPRDFSIRLNKKEKRYALKSVLTSRVLEDKIRVIDNLSLDVIKTKEIVKLLENFDLKKALIVTKDPNRNVILSANNLQGVQTATVNTLNVYDILKYDNFIVSKDAIELMEEVYV